MLNAQSGEILVMASHPTYDPNLIDEIGDSLQTDTDAPLVNRAAQGAYPPGELLDPLLTARFGTIPPPSADQITSYYNLLGLFTAPDMRLPVGTPTNLVEPDKLHVSPLQIILAFSPLSNKGIRPAPRIALAVNSPIQGWIILPAGNELLDIMEEEKATQLAESLQAPGQLFWQTEAGSSEMGRSFTWFVAGTLPNWQGTPLILIVLLEEDNTALANSIGEVILVKALEP